MATALDGIDDAFGHWLAGFIDGEGCFYLLRQNTSGYLCGLAVKLRSDDRSILLEIQERLGVGEIYYRPACGTTNSQAEWKVIRKADCAFLVRFFDRYPLRAKKARDYAIWRGAVKAWQSITPRNGALGAHDFAGLRDFKVALEDVRRFDAPAVTRADLPVSPQLVLEGAT